jgi:serine/threonine-protein kinase
MGASSASPPPSGVPVTPGEVLADKYRVDRVLGVGGMGAVVAATHLQLGTRVALKFMLPDGLGHAVYVERFLREARAAVRLRSDHVARVLDVGTLPSGSPYMVMEYLEGSDLGALIEQHGPMAPLAAVDYVLQACDAVAEAHSLGIVHRDLKPRNLFLTGRNDGSPLVKVLDFGISKDAGSPAELSLTRSHEIIGSPNYMSPEQLRSTKLADARSDIWALGVILYELVTGRVPFVAESVTHLTAMVLTEEPPPVERLRSDVPPGLARVITRCLEKDPNQRFGSIAELAAALEPFAPADTRDLAARIARIGSSQALPPGARGAASARVVVSGSTSANWSGKTELATSRSKLVLALTGVLVALLVAVGATAVALVRSNRPSSAPANATAASGPTTPAATGSTAPTAPPASGSAANSAPSSGSAASASAPSASASGSVSRGIAPSPSSTLAPGRSAGRLSGGATGSAPSTASAAAATGSASLEPPKYRTSW